MLKDLLTSEQIDSLHDYVNANVQANRCDNTLFFTEKWLAEHHISNAAAVVEAIEDAGGYCDCELLLNVIETVEYLSR